MVHHVARKRALIFCRSKIPSFVSQPATISEVVSSSLDYSLWRVGELLLSSSCSTPRPSNAATEFLDHRIEIGRGSSAPSASHRRDTLPLPRGNRNAYAWLCSAVRSPKGASTRSWGQCRCRGHTPTSPERSRQRGGRATTSGRTKFLELLPASGLYGTSQPMRLTLGLPRVVQPSIRFGNGKIINSNHSFTKSDFASAAEVPKMRQKTSKYGVRSKACIENGAWYSVDISVTEAQRHLVTSQINT